MLSQFKRLILGLSIIGLILVNLVAAYTPRGPGNVEWAAWVQAIGSILAILGAAGIAAIQHQLERARRLQVEREERQSVRAKQKSMVMGAADLVVHRLGRVVHGLNENRVGQSDVDIMKGSLDIDMEAMKRLPVWELPTPIFTTDVLMLAAALYGARTNLQAVIEAMRDQGTSAEERAGHTARVLTQLNVAKVNVPTLKDGAEELRDALASYYSRLPAGWEGGDI